MVEHWLPKPGVAGSSPVSRFAGRRGSQGIHSRRRCNGAVRWGPDGNERVTAAAAAVLFVLLAAEGATLLSIRRLLSPHVFIGMLLIPPIAVKLGSTGWRFVRYYRGAPEYRRKGPPLLPMRLLAPVVVVSTVVLFATGVAMVAVGHGRGPVLLLHKASFVVWFAATAIHVLAYLPKVPRLAFADGRPWLLVSSAIVVGAVIAVATIGSVAPR